MFTSMVFTLFLFLGRSIFWSGLEKQQMGNGAAQNSIEFFGGGVGGRFLPVSFAFCLFLLGCIYELGGKQQQEEQQQQVGK